MGENPYSTGDGCSDGEPRGIADRAQWEQLPDDPDLHDDLGYELLELDVIEATCTDQVVFLPRDEDALREDAFIVAKKHVVRELGE